MTIVISPHGPVLSSERNRLVSPVIFPSFPRYNNAGVNSKVMNISPFKRGDYVRVKRDNFQKERFDPTTSPLRFDEIGIVTEVSASGGDKRRRYLKVNGKPHLYHFSMFEAATPKTAARVRLRLLKTFKWR